MPTLAKCHFDPSVPAGKRHTLIAVGKALPGNGVGELVNNKVKEQEMDTGCTSQLTEISGVNSHWFHDIEKTSSKITEMCSELKDGMKGKVRNLVGYMDPQVSPGDPSEDPASWAEKVAKNQRHQIEALEEALAVLKSL